MLHISMQFHLQTNVSCQNLEIERDLNQKLVDILTHLQLAWHSHGEDDGNQGFGTTANYDKFAVQALGSRFYPKLVNFHLKGY